MSIETPWGRAETLRVVSRDPAIVYATTPSHGGLLLDAQATEALAKRWPGAVGACIGAGLPGPRGASWWEEDCAWALVCLAFPEAFEPDAHGVALDVVRETVDRADRGSSRMRCPHGGPSSRSQIETLRAILKDVRRYSDPPCASCHEASRTRGLDYCARCAREHGLDITGPTPTMEDTTDGR